MKTIFDRLSKISNNYREKVDDLAQDHDLDLRKDYLYSDTVQAQRVQERDEKFNRLIDEAAQKAVEAAAPEIDKMRKALRKFVTTSSDPATLATLQALLASGVMLSDSEIAAFADGADYATLRLLEKPSGGRVHAPKLESLEGDLKELETFFRDIAAYRGELGDINTARPWGQPPTVGSAIMRGQLDKFPEKLDKMQERWAVLVR